MLCPACLQTVEEIKAIIEEARKPQGIPMGAQVGGAWGRGRGLGPGGQQVAISCTGECIHAVPVGIPATWLLPFLQLYHPGTNAPANQFGYSF
jgi:hypothetical protein